MNTDFIKGVVVPILTPIDGEERIDEARLRDQVDYVIKGGVSGILAFGSNGEFYMVEEDEMERGLKIMVDQAAGRVPVYFGIGAIRTQKCCRLAKMAVANGAAGVSVLQPMFLKPTYDELFQHFKAIAESVPGTPMLLYNNPGRVGYTLTADLVDALAHQVENIVGMKDTSGDITLTAEFIRRTRDVGFKVFGGKDTLLYASLCHGAVGGVCTAANFMPELITDVYNKFAAGDEVEIVGPDTRPFSVTVPVMQDADGLPLREPRTPQMVFRMQLPRRVPAMSIVRRAVDLSAK